MKRADLMPSFVSSEEKCVPLRPHVDNKGIIDGFWRGEKMCFRPKAKDADLWILIWEEVREFHQQAVPSLEVEARQGASLQEGEAGQDALRSFRRGR